MTIRSARPDDADFIAKTILRSMRGYRPRGWFDVALGWPEAQCLDFIARVATARAVSMWHVSQFWIAEVGGEPGAALCAVPAAGTGPAAWRAIEEVAAETGLGASELDAIRRRGAYTRSCWIQGGGGDWMIEHVATEPACRDRGVVQALLAHALDQGRAAGFKRTTISFLIGNEPAERAYTKAVFAFAEREARSRVRSDHRRARLSYVCGDDVKRCSRHGRIRATWRGPTMLVGWREPLGAHEADVLEHLAAGLTNKEIARRMHLSARTVEGYRASI